MKSGGLNILEPSGFVQACNGIALALESEFPWEKRRLILLMAVTDVDCDGHNQHINTLPGKNAGFNV